MRNNFSGMAKDPKITTTLRLSASTRDALKVAAREDVRSLSSAVEVACRRWLAERQNEKAPRSGGAFNI
jgi:predicted DNA-binding ribbon-helix-helix protein